MRHRRRGQKPYNRNTAQAHTYLKFHLHVSFNLYDLGIDNVRNRLASMFKNISSVFMHNHDSSSCKVYYSYNVFLAY